MARLSREAHLVEFWRGRRVLITGHTGFKGSWLSSMLLHAGASLSGFALPPQTEPNLFTLLGLSEAMASHIGDVRDEGAVADVIAREKPQVVFHLAAQALVRASYEQPVETFATNVMGTANLLQACRTDQTVEAIVVVTTDKTYQNHEKPQPYREGEALGGDDPYSSSKAGAELVAHAYRTSFFNGARVATARAGNVIGGGDWSPERIVPDVVKAVINKEAPVLRYPDAIRPWQHVLEPSIGYMQLAQSLSHDRGFAKAWNFGPPVGEHATVRELTERLLTAMGASTKWEQIAQKQPHEATTLMLDSALARERLHWRSRLSQAETLDWTARWYEGWHRGEDPRALTQSQIEEYLAR